MSILFESVTLYSMSLVNSKGLYISVNQPTNQNHLAAVITIVNADNESAGFEVLIEKEALRRFAQKLKTFPKDMHEIVDIIWNTGKQHILGKVIETGQLRLSVKVVEPGGYSELKFELLEVKVFVPGVKFCIAVGAQPLSINQLGLSLENWAIQPSSQFSFTL
ncbi:MAG: hypothetical protein JNM24_17930 [Bdellovibrionaceae bacterium]|nr:hypothetical protein [Pseudobdellovibrionaceae bacterium]